VVASTLRPSPHQWRKHPDRQANALRGVLAEVGWADALVARELPGGALELIDGHLRAETAPNAKVPVLVLDVTAAEARKLCASLDPLAALAIPDVDALHKLLEGVPTDNEALASVYGELASIGDLDVDGLVQDEPPAPPDTARTSRGDLWLLGEHRLLCGDSSLAVDVDRLTEGRPIDLVNMDPPYNVSVQPRSNAAIAAAGEARGHHQQLDAARKKKGAKPKAPQKLRAKDRALANDFLPPAEFERLLAAWFGQAARVLTPGRGFYIWGGYANLGNYPPALAAAGFYLSQAIIWVKEHAVLTRKDLMGNHEWCFYGARDFEGRYDSCLYGWLEGAAHRFFGPPSVTDVWTVKKVNPQSMVHLTEKPVELAARAMHYSSRSGERVLDLFGGSGSTLIAAEQLSRQARLMEIDPLYCDVIVDRWEAFTGRKAKLAEPAHG
jgi:DNA modification methylase